MDYDKFMAQTLKAHKEFVQETWVDWQEYIATALKRDVQTNYPDGFKDFLIEKLEVEIKRHSKKK